MNRLYLRVQESWKAVAATLTTAAITFLTSTGEGLSTGEAARSVALSLLGGLVVFLTKNKEKRTRPLRAARQYTRSHE